MNVFICPMCGEAVHERFLHGFRWISMQQFEYSAEKELAIFFCGSKCTSNWLLLDYETQNKQLEKLATAVKSLKVSITFEDLKE
jgi:hypothetical protein